MKSRRQKQEHETGLGFDTRELQAWLNPLADLAKVECADMSRLISYLLDKNGIMNLVSEGLLIDVVSLNDPAVAYDKEAGVTHWWLELGYGYIIDYRARMWMGEEAQNGVFIPTAGRFEYRALQRFKFDQQSIEELSLICGRNLSDWPLFNNKF